MAAQDAFDVLINPKHIVTTAVTIPEGLRVADTVAILAAKTKFSTAQFEAALQDTAALGLPSYAKGNPEGYLFPSTYGFGPKEKPADMLKDMVDRWKQSADENDLEAGAAAQGKTPGRDHDDRQPDPGRGPGQRHAEGQPGHLQPARRPGRPGRHQRAPPDRRDRQLRARPEGRGGGDHGRGAQHRSRRTTPTSTRDCRPARSTRRATRRSRRRSIRRTAPGTTT